MEGGQAAPTLLIFRTCPGHVQVLDEARGQVSKLSVLRYAIACRTNIQQSHILPCVSEALFKRPPRCHPSPPPTCLQSLRRSSLPYHLLVPGHPSAPQVPPPHTWCQASIPWQSSHIMTPNEYLQQGRWQYISGGSTLLNSGEINCQSPDKLKAKVWTPKQLTHLPPLKPSHPGGSRVRCRAGCRSGLRRHASCFHGCSCSCRNRQSARRVEQSAPLGNAEGGGIPKAAQGGGNWMHDQVTLPIRRGLPIK